MPATALAQLPTVFVSHPGEIVRLDDLTADGDYLDFGETTVFATGLPNTISALASTAGGVFVVDPASASIFAVRDLNGDGDALDFGEVTLYAQLPSGIPPPNLVGLAVGPDGSLYSADSTTNTLYRFVDLNGDGDALDFGEAVIVATGLTSPSAIAARPDGALLLAQLSASVPVLILKDRNGDGDFLDFAEEITYGENFAFGTRIAAPTDRIAYLLRPSDDRVLRLQDLTQDDDVLDFGEVVTFAEGLGLTSAAAFAAADVGRLFVATADATGTVYLLDDLNGDGDALDFGEVAVVAQGITQPAGLAVATHQTTCLHGDLDANGTVNTNDVVPFVNGLLGLESAELCRIDTNQDGQVDGRDIAAFVALLRP